LGERASLEAGPTGLGSLAIDLYRGKVATTPDMAHEIMRGVPEERAKRDLHAAVEFLKSQPNVSKDRLGAIGWCMGGGYALDVAGTGPCRDRDQLRPPGHGTGNFEKTQCFHAGPVSAH
jgi:dienelactone hydrolase